MGLPIGQHATSQHPAVPARGSRPHARIIADPPASYPHNDNSAGTFPTAKPFWSSDCAPRMRGTVLIAYGLAHRSTRDTPMPAVPARGSRPGARIIADPPASYPHNDNSAGTFPTAKPFWSSDCAPRMRGTVLIAYGLAHRSTRDTPMPAVPARGSRPGARIIADPPRIITPPQRQSRRDTSPTAKLFWYIRLRE